MGCGTGGYCMYFIILPWLEPDLPQHFGELTELFPLSPHQEPLLLPHPKPGVITQNWENLNILCWLGKLDFSESSMFSLLPPLPGLRPHPSSHLPFLPPPLPQISTSTSEEAGLTWTLHGSAGSSSVLPLQSCFTPFFLNHRKRGL